MHESGLSPTKVTVIQDGARLHYAVPLAMQRINCLERMYTTWYSAPGSVSRATASVLKTLHFKPAISMLHRYCPELKTNRIWSLGSVTLCDRLFRKCFKSKVQRHLWGAERVAKYVRRKGVGESNIMLGFLLNMHPDLLRFAKEKGLTTICDQYIAPVAVQAAEEKIQNTRFPGWALSQTADVIFEQLQAWEQKCLQFADHVTCASEYVRQGLIEIGIDAGRLSVLPYPIDCSQFNFVDRSARQGPLHVGFVGAVGLRKGAPYFLEVAKRSSKDRVRFTMVGTLQLAPAALAQLGQHVNIVGSVPRPEVMRWLTDFDAYFLPSTCEGSAGSVMEAMATGLPIVTSLNAGSIVEHGISGFLAPYDDIDAHVQAIEILCANRAKRAEIALAARATAEDCSIDAYSRQWQELFSRLSSTVGQAV